MLYELGQCSYIGFNHTVQRVKTKYKQCFDVETYLPIQSFNLHVVLLTVMSSVLFPPLCSSLCLFYDCMISFLPKWQINNTIQ